MEKQDFSVWLVQELASARFALLALLEKQDYLLYNEGPKLRNDYMVKIGAFEEEVIEAELDVAMLERKVTLIQVAINQRKPVDLEAIDKQLAEERSQKLSEIEASERRGSGFKALPDDEEKELQAKYKQIVHDYHPQVNKAATQTQKDLYEKAVEVYKNHNLDAMRLIYDMLYVTEETSEMEMSVIEKEVDMDEQIQSIADYYVADYALAAELYPFFQQTERDAVMLNMLDGIKQSINETEASLLNLENEFPFSAREVILNQDKAEEYLAELNMRLKKSEQAKAETNSKIAAVLETVK